MAPKDTFTKRLVDGSESAARNLDDRYRQRLCALVEREMDRRLRRREDPEDVVQSVFRTFFRRASLGEFQFDHSGALWRLLQMITRRKILKHVEKAASAKRSPDKEEYTDVATLPSPEPTAAEARLLGEVIENVLAGLEPVDAEVLRLHLHGYTIAEVADIVVESLESPYPEVLHLRLQGHSQLEIAQKLGCGRESVRYWLDRICDRLRKLLGDAAAQ